jgi:diguanylate cyclase (GGDEF)-like protein/PAS domain S-box-containing protein
MYHRKERNAFSGDVEAFCADVMRGVAEGKVATRTHQLPNGRAFQVINTPLAQGGWVATIEEITERLNLEQERDRNYTFLREIIDHIPSQITVKDARTRQYLLINSTAAEQFGQSREAVVGKTPFDIYPVDAARVVTDDDSKALQTTEGLSKDEHAWPSQTMGLRYITSTRIGIRDSSGEPRYLINVVDDVTERRRADEKIAHMAHYDALTDLPNRTLFREQIERELEKVAGGEQFALLYIDVDEFKGINDSLGHHVGDELLKAIADRIRACLRPGDLIARLGGDEFAVIQTALAEVNDAALLAQRLRDSVGAPYSVDGHHVVVDISVGIAMSPDDGVTVEELLKSADLAAYAAKASGRGTFRFFEAEMDRRIKLRRVMELDLRHALGNGEFRLFYQPIVSLQTGEVTSLEALIRWQHPVRGLIPPGDFIPLAEELGLIVPIGEWVINRACADAATWGEHIKVAVNLSPIQLTGTGLLDVVIRALARAGLPASRLEFEITETVLMQNTATTLATLHQLRALGIHFSMDDFGTGYSSLSTLRSFPFNKIKIDRSFVKDITDQKSSLAIIKGVTSLAHSLNMLITIEGVETEEQLAHVRPLGCAEIQGYLLSPPKSLEEIMRQFLPKAAISTSAA